MLVNLYVLLLNILLFRQNRYMGSRDKINITHKKKKFISRDKPITSEIRHQSDMKKDLKQIVIGSEKLECILWTGVQCGD